MSSLGSRIPGLAALRPLAVALAATVVFGQLSARAESPNTTLTELIDVLAKNGQITPEQSAALKRSAVLAQEAAAPKTSAAAPAAAPAPKVMAVPKIKDVTRLMISGKVHAQWDNLDTDVSNGADPVTRNAFSMRRVQLDVTADLGPAWSGTFTGDFAASAILDQAYLTYKGLPGHELRFGHAKVPFVWEESLSSSVLKGVERSASHRAVVEHSGRGIGSKNSGVHLRSSAPEGFYYAASVSNPGAKNSAGQAGNVSNGLAYWSRVGANIAAPGGRLDLSVDAGYLPDFMTAGAVSAYATHAHYRGKQFDVLAEIVGASYPRAGKPDSNLTGFTIEPAYRLTKEWEVVVRYSMVDSDGIGVSPGSLIRSAADTGTFDHVDSYYFGGNYYVVGNSVKLTFGFEHAVATDPVSSAARKNTINGLRTRLQLLF